MMKQKRLQMEKNTILGTFRKNNSEEIVIQESNLRGNYIIDVRVFTNYPTGQPLPTKKGFTFLKDKWNDFKDTINKIGE